VADEDVMGEQWARLAQAVADPASPIAIQGVTPDAGPHPMLTGGPVELLRFQHPALADRVVVRSLYPEVTVTDNVGAVRAYQAVMDRIAALALPPRTPLPQRRGAVRA
jgi:hypothetical protein